MATSEYYEYIDHPVFPFPSEFIVGDMAGLNAEIDRAGGLFVDNDFKSSPDPSSLPMPSFSFKNKTKKTKDPSAVLDPAIVADIQAKMRLVGYEVEAPATTTPATSLPITAPPLPPRPASPVKAAASEPVDWLTYYPPGYVSWVVPNPKYVPGGEGPPSPHKVTPLRSACQSWYPNGDAPPTPPASPIKDKSPAFAIPAKRERSLSPVKNASLRIDNKRWRPAMDLPTPPTSPTKEMASLAPVVRDMPLSSDNSTWGRGRVPQLAPPTTVPQRPKQLMSSMEARRERIRNRAGGGSMAKASGTR